MQLSILPDAALSRGEAQLKALGARSKDSKLEHERLKSAAREFESIMLEIMVKEMRKNVPESPIFGHNNGREIFNEMLDSQYVRLISKHGGLGMANLLVKQLDPKP